ADPTAAAAELGAQFLENTSSFICDEDLDGAIESGVMRRDPCEGFYFAAAMDPSGLRNDPWALAIVGKRGEDTVQFVSHSWKPGPSSSVEQVVSEIREELHRFGTATIYADQYGSEVTKALFGNAGI